MESHDQHTGLPHSCDIRRLGLSPDEITSVEPISQRHINTIYRICCNGRWYVLKCIDRPEMSTELLAYRLLLQERVPVLPHRAGENALLLEDLAHSEVWRLAEEADMAREETGRAIAEWYRRFHDAGRRLLARQTPGLDSLQREADRVTATSVRSLPTRLALRNVRVLDWAAEQVEQVVRAIHQLPQTLSYNDFHWSNLAMRRTGGQEGIVFDYHLLGIGMAYSDCRNVVGSLLGGARDAFHETYGKTSDLERLLDAPVAVLHALLQAAECTPLPRWAGPLIDMIDNGTFERELHAALEAIGRE